LIAALALFATVALNTQDKECQQARIAPRNGEEAK